MKLLQAIGAMVLSIALCSLPSDVLAASKSSSKLEEKAYQATGVLFAQHPDTGEWARLCTIWNVAKIRDGYEAVSADHCATIEGDYPDADLNFAVSYSDVTGKLPTDLVPAKVIAHGDWQTINDIALWDVQTSTKLPVLKLGDSDELKNGEDVFNVSIPFEGIDKSVYKGYVSQVKVISPEPDLDGKIHSIIFGTGPGSSGSAVLSEKQGAVIGELVQGAPEQGELLVPVNLIKAFMAAHPEATTPRIVPKPVVIVPKGNSDVDSESNSEPSYPDMWQHGHGSRGDHGRGHSGGDRSNHGKAGRRPDPRSMDRDHHARVQGNRYVDGRRQVYFGGFWFGCEVWPSWIFTDEVYVVMGPNGIWFVYDFSDPNLFVQVVFVE